MKRCIFYLTAAIHILCFSTPRARADEYFSFVEVHCVPSIGLFSIKSFSEYNLPDVDNATTEVLESVEKSEGIFLLSRFIEKEKTASDAYPFTCQIDSGKKPHTVKVYTTWYHAPEARGFCGGAESATFIIKIDDAVVSQMNAGGGCDEKSESRDSILINFGMSTLEKCSEYKGFSIDPTQEPKPIKETCQVKKF